MLRPLLTILLLLAVNSQIAQDMIVYYESQPGQNQTDTLYVYFQSLTGQSLDVSSVTMSVCYTGSAQLQPSHVKSEFASLWGTSYELCSSEAELASYEGIQFANRAKYGITTLSPSGVTIPAATSGLGVLMLKLPFNVSGSAYGQYYLESTAQNAVNEIGNNQGNPIDFVTWNAASPFPVEWLNFHAQATDAGHVNLDWQTASELNNNYFEVEKSFDGAFFQSLDRLGGESQSSEVQSYTYVDTGHMRAEMFYRIKQVDINGAFSYSDMIQVNMTHVLNKNFKVSPVPFDDQFTIQATGTQESDNQVSIYDVTGRLIVTHYWEAGQQQMTIPTTQLKSGVYILKIVDSFGKVESTPLVKK